MAQRVTPIVSSEPSIMLQVMGKSKGFLLGYSFCLNIPLHPQIPHQFVLCVDSILSLLLKTLLIAYILTG